MKTWIKIGLFWGLCMFLIMNIIFPLLNREEITVPRLLIGAVIWLIGGFIFGRIFKKPAKKQAK
ncbi:hypothetical protein [Flavobacterium suaedae]|uniref:hypothetical protein n=1 Tax=Flavobacterium suaedae TaxID=1767027 RepID=UPI00166B3F26|nr:hypothetical protein [Flavobacterium suaedae]